MHAAENKSIDHHPSRSLNKAFDHHATDLKGADTSTNHRMKRKASSINAEIVHSNSKKLDVVKSTEFEPRNAYDPSIADSAVHLPTHASTIDRENDGEDFTDRIFNYLDENDHDQPASINPSTELTMQCSTPSSSAAPLKAPEQEIKPLLCAFCPYFARDIHEFQIHIAKHTEKNFRCLLCNCMYKYRRDCVTHMKRKHSTNVTGSISQYIQKIPSTSNNAPCPLVVPSNPTASANQMNSTMEPKRYGCPYCSLMTKSTSSIYKHQSRKHASYPKIVHKYSTDDPTTRSLVAVLKQKTLKKTVASNDEGNDCNSIVRVRSIIGESPLVCTEEQASKVQRLDESIHSSDLLNLSNKSSSSTSVVHQQTEATSTVNRHRCAASKHITAHNIQVSSGRVLKVYQCSLCGYRARHRSNAVRHVKNLHVIERTIYFDPSDPAKTVIHSEENLSSEHSNESEDMSDALIIAEDEQEEGPEHRDSNYSLHTTIQTPLMRNPTDKNDSTVKPFADIHLSINIFLPKRRKSMALEESASDESTTDEHHLETLSDEEIGATADTDADTTCQISSSHHANLANGPLYKPHKCRRCFYRSNWKTDMLHHVRLKHQITQASKSDYTSMDFQSALRTFSAYEETFGKVLKNRLLLPKIDYINCTWEELKSKLFLHDEPYRSSSSPEQKNEPFLSISNDEKHLHAIDSNQRLFDSLPSE